MHLKLLLISSFVVFSNYCLISAAPTAEETSLDKKNVQELNPVVEDAKTNTDEKTRESRHLKKKLFGLGLGGFGIQIGGGLGGGYGGYGGGGYGGGYESGYGGGYSGGHERYQGGYSGGNGCDACGNTYVQRQPVVHETYQQEVKQPIVHQEIVRKEVIQPVYKQKVIQPVVREEVYEKAPIYKEPIYEHSQVVQQQHAQNDGYCDPCAQKQQLQHGGSYGGGGSGAVSHSNSQSSAGSGSLGGALSGAFSFSESHSSSSAGSHGKKK